MTDRGPRWRVERNEGENRAGEGFSDEGLEIVGERWRKKN